MQSLRKKIKYKYYYYYSTGFLLVKQQQKQKQKKKQLISIKVLKTIYGSLCARISQICGKKTA